MSMIEKMMEFMMGRMSKNDKEAMMDKMMEDFFGDMTAEDKKKMMEEMMPKMMEGVNMMEMMPKMMSSNKETETPMMPQMMMTMMPKCLTMMLPEIPKEKRVDFVFNMVTTLMEKGRAGMSEEEKKDFVAKVVEKIKA